MADLKRLAARPHLKQMYPTMRRIPVAMTSPLDQLFQLFVMFVQSFLGFFLDFGRQILAASLF